MKDKNAKIPKQNSDKSTGNLNPADELHIQLLAGEGYEAGDIDDLMDQLEGRKKLKPIKR